MIATAPRHCPVCSGGNRHRDSITVTLTRGDATIITHHVPATTCDICAIEFLDEATTATLHQYANAMIAAGVKREVRNYVTPMA